jgi:hypothetical protein
MSILEKIKDKLHNRVYFENQFYQSLGIQHYIHENSNRESKQSIFEFLRQDEYKASYSFFKYPSAKNFCDIRKVCLDWGSLYSTPNKVFYYMIDKGVLSLYDNWEDNTPEKFIFDQQTKAFHRPNNQCGEDSLLAYILLNVPSYTIPRESQKFIAKTPEFKNLIAKPEFMAKYIDSILRQPKINYDFNFTLINLAYPEGYNMDEIKQYLFNQGSDEDKVWAKQHYESFFQDYDNCRNNLNSISEKIKSLRTSTENTASYNQQLKA